MSGFKVCAEQCDQCLFSKNRIVSKKRMQQILRECKQNDTHFICHKHEDVCCRGFFDANPFATNLMRIAARLNVVKEVK